ncbi:hypothetical protein F383_37230 [Gossypium arboreum]|nr:hypothetical protein F383_37230 [Gossypium arboreum]
MCNLTD